MSSSSSGSDTRTRGLLAAAGIGGLLLGLGVAVGATSCTGAEPEEPKDPDAWELSVDKSLFDATWPMAVVDDEVRKPLEEPDWVALTFHRDIRKAVQESGGESDWATARAHADAAALYRQGAMGASTAYVQYFDKPLGQAYDPAEKVHLMMVGKAILADHDGAKSHIEAVQALGEDSAVSAWAAPWLALYESDKTWPVDLSGLPYQPPPVKPGEWPELGEARPSYEVQEQEPGTHSLKIDDPALLVQLAMWHDAAARQAAGDKAGLIDIYGARYRMPIEPDVVARDALPLELLFGSDYLHPGDGAFMAAVTGSEGLAAVEAHEDSSFIASVVVAVRGDNGKIDAEKAVDLANDLRKAWKTQQGLARGGEHPSHPIFADVAVAGLYRNLAMVAELEGDRETSGKLRIAAKDMGERDAAAAPEGLLSLTAWDAANQYTIRGLEIVHQQARRAPSLEVVRTALDLLAIRVGRSRGAGGTPGM